MRPIPKFALNFLELDRELLRTRLGGVAKNLEIREKKGKNQFEKKLWFSQGIEPTTF